MLVLGCFTGCTDEHNHHQNDEPTHDVVLVGDLAVRFDSHGVSELSEQVLDSFGSELNFVKEIDNVTTVLFKGLG